MLLLRATVQAMTVPVPAGEEHPRVRDIVGLCGDLPISQSCRL